ncbi:nuclear transport factor 2 family protein [Belliella sp. R4-6]|uniref:Nuclear transport factor 2 family protein n=1 Tax=Belliella alkalica TaxID=1730871 RepID=A0ABS9VB44_9BACT|nr:nuclear transport factor 2 family protein [Belliella alkalica]MCH7413656.1 nuclear transport factor 2 family protein [Belliella alkalica]
MKATLILIAFLSFGFFACAQSKSDKELITEAVHNYFEGMIERDRHKLDMAFDPNARLIGYRGSVFTITNYEDWATGTSKGQARDPEQYKNEIKQIEIKGYTAIAKTELFWPGIYYFDFLTLIKIDKQWKIVHKTWYEETVE